MSVGEKLKHTLGKWRTKDRHGQPEAGTETSGSDQRSSGPVVAKASAGRAPSVAELWNIRRRRQIEAFRKRFAGTVLSAGLFVGILAYLTLFISEAAGSEATPWKWVATAASPGAVAGLQYALFSAALVVNIGLLLNDRFRRPDTDAFLDVGIWRGGLVLIIRTLAGVGLMAVMFVWWSIPAGIFEVERLGEMLAATLVSLGVTALVNWIPAHPALDGTAGQAQRLVQRQELEKQDRVWKQRLDLGDGTTPQRPSRSRCLVSWLAILIAIGVCGLAVAAVIFVITQFTDEVVTAVLEVSVLNLLAIVVLTVGSIQVFGPEAMPTSKRSAWLAPALWTATVTVAVLVPLSLSELDDPSLGEVPAWSKILTAVVVVVATATITAWCWRSFFRETAGSHRFGRLLWSIPWALGMHRIHTLSEDLDREESVRAVPLASVDLSRGAGRLEP